MPNSGRRSSQNSLESRLLDEEFEKARDEANIAEADTASVRAEAAATVARAEASNLRARALFNQRRREI